MEAKVIERYRALRRMAAQGATEQERATAAQHAAAMEQRYPGIEGHAAHEGPQAQPEPPPWLRDAGTLVGATAAAMAASFADRILRGSQGGVEGAASEDDDGEDGIDPAAYEWAQRHLEISVDSRKDGLRIDLIFPVRRFRALDDAVADDVAELIGLQVSDIVNQLRD
jgi:hypothetical protein